MRLFTALASPYAEEEVLSGRATTVCAEPTTSSFCCGEDSLIPI